MVFSSFTFLFAFLPIFLLSYFASPKKVRNLVAVLGSYFFYAWGAPKVVILLFLSSLVDYLLSQKIASHPQRRIWFTLGILQNLSILLYFKYANFFYAELSRLFELFGSESLGTLDVLLPIGVSFFTFQKISYLSDVYQRTTSVSSSFLNYLLYVAFFPQLIAGPIVRYHDVDEQIRNREYVWIDVVYGAYRFCFGLGKKVLLANPLGAVADNVFALESSSLPLPYAWLGIFCYALQIYFDFSGYSDMAIGLGRICGFHFLENFNWPYTAKSITEFWRRWHISLSNWMKEYLYIPLGGNRVSSGRVYFNLVCVFFLSGLWHGASWNFILWGLLHGGCMIFERVFLLQWLKKIPSPLRVAQCFFIVLLSWVLFRAETLEQAFAYYSAMFGLSPVQTTELKVAPADIIHTRGWFTLLLASFLAFSPLFIPRLREQADTLKLSASRYPAPAFLFFACLLYLLSVLSLSTSSYDPFLYFRF